MKRFMGKNFLLDTETARRLYHGEAAMLPICDFHCHIPVKQIAENKPFRSITEVWLGGDHYKWRVMRVAGIHEAYITGNATDEEKFMAWAETMPKMPGNPLYHWTHLELQRYFGIDEPLSPKTAPAIWRATSERITSMRPQQLIADSNVKLLCTTDDPADSLEWHQTLAKQNDSGARILPAWRPDRALRVTAPDFAAYVAELSRVSGMPIENFEQLKQALTNRMEFFHANGCRLSDHALDTIPYGALNDELAARAFEDRLRGEGSPALDDAYRVALMVFFASEYSRLGWTMQLHIGAMRNVNLAAFERLGADTGYDGMADAPIALPLVNLLRAMSSRAELPRTLLFTLNDKDNFTLSVLAGSLQKDGVAAHVHQGPAWWFHDQKDGMEKQIRTLANVSLLSEFVGMTTDSRSLLSYTRHEYFRRILCNLLGNWVENGEYPDDEDALRTLLRKVCFENAMGIFNPAMSS